MARARPRRGEEGQEKLLACEGGGGSSSSVACPSRRPHQQQPPPPRRPSTTTTTTTTPSRSRTTVAFMLCGAGLALAAAAALPTAAASGRALLSSAAVSAASSSSRPAGLLLPPSPLIPPPRQLVQSLQSASPLAPMKEPKDKDKSKSSGSSSSSSSKQQREQDEQQQRAQQVAALLPAGTPQWATSVLRVDPSWSEQIGDLVLPHGYPLQTFNLTTRDGYVLAVHRIPYGRSPTPPPLEVWPSEMDPSGAAAQMKLAAAKQSLLGNVTSLLTGGWLQLESGQVGGGSGGGNNRTAAVAGGGAKAATATKAAAAPAAAAAKPAAVPAAAPPAPTPAAAAATPTTPAAAAAKKETLTATTTITATTPAVATTRLVKMMGKAGAAAGARIGDGIESAGEKVADWAQAGLRPVTGAIHKVTSAVGKDAAAVAAAVAAAEAAEAAKKAAAAPPPPPKPIAMLIHGLSVSSAGWVVLGPDDALAFKLADAGYDVWMPNTRGSLYSQRHLTLQPNQKEFWAYSLDEQAVVDLPAFIDLALNVTGAKTVTLFGHSQGGILELMTLSARPEYNGKVDLAIGLAPVYFPAMIATPLIRFMLNLEMYKLLGILTAAGVQDVVPNWMIGRLLGNPQCSTGVMDSSPCLSLIHTTLAGKYGFISPSDFDAISRTWPASVGLRNLLHWVEIAKEPGKTNAIIPYPCGDDCAKCADSPVALGSCRARLAIKRRGGGGSGGVGGGGGGPNPTTPAPVIPAEYNLSAITTKVAVLGGDMDLLAPPDSYRLLKERLPEGSFVEYDASAQAGHMDVTWGRKAPWYTASVAMMKKHTSGVPQPGYKGGAGFEPFGRIAGVGGWTAVGGPVVVREEGAVASAAEKKKKAPAPAVEANKAERKAGGGGSGSGSRKERSRSSSAKRSSQKEPKEERKGLFSGFRWGSLFGGGRRD